VAQDRAQAINWWEQAAHAGHVEAASEVGSALLEGDGTLADTKAALRWLQQAADAGSAKAQWNLGGLYASGRGLATDIKQAFVWCQRAANQGFTPAQATLGILFERIGKTDEAVACLRRAADLGDAEAQYNLALLLAKGQGEGGAAADPEGAFLYLEQAAQQGVASAQSRLALAYGQGQGVAADGVEAHKWLLLASHRGDALAKANLTFSQSQMTPAQMLEAARRAKSWRANRSVIGSGTHGTNGRF
jgi:TPR repeat protein